MITKAWEFWNWWLYGLTTITRTRTMNFHDKHVLMMDTVFYILWCILYKSYSNWWWRWWCLQLSRPSGDCPCLGYRKPGQPYQWISYTEVWHVLMFHPQHFSFVCLSLLFADWTSPTPQVAEKARLLGSGLLAKGCQPNPQQFVGIFAPNRPEVWTVSFYIF